MTKMRNIFKSSLNWLLFALVCVLLVTLNTRGSSNIKQSLFNQSPLNEDNLLQQKSLNGHKTQLKTEENDMEGSSVILNDDHRDTNLDNNRSDISEDVNRKDIQEDLNGKDIPEDVNRKDVPVENKQKDDEVFIMSNGSKCFINPIQDSEDFFNYLDKQLYPCSDLRPFGGKKMRDTMDGHKMVCLDDRYKINANNCLVLSFGINNEWSFDDAMDNFGCDVYAFDPTMRGAQDHIRGKHIHFYRLGISNKKGEMPIGKVNSLEGILNDLKLQDRDIDYLKIDVESHEIEVFDNIINESPYLLSKIKQIGMEVHPGKVLGKVLATQKMARRRIPSYYRQFQILECFGFRLGHMELNMVPYNPYMREGIQRSSCYEIVFYNTYNWPDTKV